MDKDSNTPKRVPLELIITVGKVAVLIASYFLIRRRRKRWYGDKW